jgi:hypothetical protein
LTDVTGLDLSFDFTTYVILPAAILSFNDFSIGSSSSSLPPFLEDITLFPGLDKFFLSSFSFFCFSKSSFFFLSYSSFFKRCSSFFFSMSSLPFFTIFSFVSCLLLFEDSLLSLLPFGAFTFPTNDFPTLLPTVFFVLFGVTSPFSSSYFLLSLLASD